MMDSLADLKRLAGLQPYRQYLDLKSDGDHFKAVCPWHDDKNPSLIVYQDGHHHCFACEAHGDALDLIRQLDRCELPQAVQRLEEVAGITPQASKGPGELVAVYPYRDEADQLLFEVCRYAPKTFRQRKPDGDGWTWKLGDVRKPLYRLSEVLKSPVVFIVEGEKDADNAKRHGLTATTTAGGANAPWLQEYTDVLTGKTVFIIPDNDEPGRKRAQRVCEYLKGAAEEALIVELPAPHKDLSDYFEAGNTVDGLRALIGPAREKAKQGLRSWFDSLQSLHSIQAPDVSYLVQHLIPDGALVLFAGKPGAFKSFLALDIAGAIAAGKSFAGRPPSPARPVLYLDAENGPQSVVARRRFLAIATSAQFKYWGRFSDRPIPKLDDPQLVEFAAAAKPFIVVDSLIRFHVGSENDNAEMAVTMGKLLSLARSGATVLVLHHAGKDNDLHFRGATEIEAAPDVCFKIKRVGGKDSKEVTLIGFKNRFAQEREHELMLSETGFQWMAEEYV